MDTSEKKYIPEYNPLKYKKAMKNTKITSIVFFTIMIWGVGIVLFNVFFNANAFIVNVNGIPKKDWEWIIIILSMIIAIFGLSSFFVFMVYRRLKKANAMFSEPDEKKRIEMFKKINKEEEMANKISSAYNLYNISKDIK